MAILSIRKTLICTVATIGLSLPAAAYTQQRQFNLPAQSATNSIPEFARQAGVQIIAPGSKLRGVRTPTIKGEYDMRAALDALLKGTGLKVVSQEGNMITLGSAVRRPQTQATSFSSDDLASAPAPTPALSRYAEVQEQASVGAAPSPAENSADIIVTALKRDTRIQETPISISAVTGESLSNSGIQGLSGLASTTPSLSVADGGPQDRRIVLRGIQASGEPTVGLYYDEVPVTGSLGGQADAGRNTPEIRLFDVERVEVLRGPQGTLYGAGSMGGTVRLIFAKPKFETEHRIDSSISNTDGGGVNYEVNGLVNVPIIDDKIALRVVGYYRNNNGFIDNPYLNLKNINDEETYGGRAMLRLQPTEDMTIDLSATINRLTTSDTTWIREAGKYNTDSRVRQPLTDSNNLYSATIAYDFGDVRATAVGSYMNRHFYYVNDPTSQFLASLGTQAAYDRACTGAAAGRCTNPAYVQPGAPGVPAGGITNFQQYLDYVAAQSTSTIISDTRARQFTGEFRLDSTGDGPFNWTAGAFYSWRKIKGEITQGNADPATGILIQPLEISTHRTSTDVLKQLAGFADVSWDVTPQLNVAGGVRFFKFMRDVVNQTDVPSILSGAVAGPPITNSGDESGHVIRLNASYKINRNLMVYGQAAQGFRPGGVNNVLGLPSELAPYNSDKLWNYEAGIKSTLLGGMMTLNFNGFWIDWSNIQLTARTTNGVYSFITNSGAARVKGLELDSTIRPFKGLTIQGSASYIDAKLTENQGNAQISAAGLKGDRIPYVPKYQAGLGVQYETPLNDSLNLLTRVDYSHTGGSMSDFRPFVAGGASRFTRSIEAYDLVNIRFGVEGEHNEWGAYVFVTNLFADTAVTRASSGTLQFGKTFVASARPRTIGLNLRGAF